MCVLRLISISADTSHDKLAAIPWTDNRHPTPDSRRRLICGSFAFLLASLIGSSQVHAAEINRISSESIGQPTTDGANWPSISGDGSVVVFNSDFDSYIPYDQNVFHDVFGVGPNSAGFIIRLSEESNFGTSNGESTNASVSDDGRFVAFESAASNLVTDDGNGVRDIFVRSLTSPFTTERVSIGPDGSNGNSNRPSISGDGRFVAFASESSNLVPNDGNNARDIFVFDRTENTIERVSVGPDGSNNYSFDPSISGDGRFVAFVSTASNLVPNDGNGEEDIFVYDRSNDTIERVSVGPNGSNGESIKPSISDDGQFVAFSSQASNLVPNDGNSVSDIFVYDRINSTLQRLTAGPNEFNSSSYNPSITGDGRFVAFQSNANNIVPNDGNVVSDIFVYNRSNDTIERVSVGPNGSDGRSFRPSISNDGTAVAFVSEATNLVVPNDDSAPDIFVSTLCNGKLVDVSLSNGDTPTSGDDVILGTQGDDSIIAMGGNDTICALGGDDTVSGGRGNDWIDAGDGNDNVDGGNDNDVIFGRRGLDTLNGGPGDDEISGDEDGDNIRGNSGNDTLYGGNGVDQLIGGSGDDLIWTGPGGNLFSGFQVYGGGGDDTIFGGPDRDEIRGATGNDFIYGGANSDALYGGGGNDTIWGQDGHDTIYGNGSKDTLYGGDGEDIIYGGDSADEIHGGDSHDFLYGSTGNDVMYGGPGDDTLEGQGGNDTLFGNRGDDVLFGGGSNDTLNGGSNTDYCNGDTGIDSQTGCEIPEGIP